MMAFFLSLLPLSFSLSLSLSISYFPLTELSSISVFRSFSLSSFLVSFNYFIFIFNFISGVSTTYPITGRDRSIYPAMEWLFVQIR
jgi:hypothetical protein